MKKYILPLILIATFVFGCTKEDTPKPVIPEVIFEMEYPERWGTIFSGVVPDTALYEFVFKNYGSPNEQKWFERYAYFSYSQGLYRYNCYNDTSSLLIYSYYKLKNDLLLLKKTQESRYYDTIFIGKDNRIIYNGYSFIMKKPN
jgi:hypothetical protein